jgi:hypothetical protein
MSEILTIELVFEFNVDNIFFTLQTLMNRFSLDTFVKAMQPCITYEWM